MSELMFNLINSLSNREKAYFKKHSNILSQNNNKNYLKLYQTLESMNVYDKKYLDKALKGTKIEKYLSSEMNYLKNKILKSLFNFHLANSDKSRIVEGIVYIEMLLLKGLKKDALKKLKFVKKIAYQREDFTAVLKLIDLEEDCTFTEGSISYLQTLEASKIERKKLISLQQNLNEFKILRAEVRQLQFGDWFLKCSQKNTLSENKIKILNRRESCLSKKSTDHWYYSRTMKFYLERDFKSALQNSIEHLEFLKENEELFPKNAWPTIVSNYMYMSALLANSEHYNKSIAIIGSFMKDEDLDIKYLNYVICSRSLSYSYFSNDIQLAKFWLQKSIAFTQDDKDLTKVQSAHIHLEIVRCCLLLKDYELGAKMVNILLQNDLTDYHQALSRIYSIMIHYKLSWFKLLESEINQLFKLKKDFPNEDHIINHFYTFFKGIVHQKQRDKDLIIELQSNFLELSKKQDKDFLFCEFDFYGWSMEL